MIDEQNGQSATSEGGVSFPLDQLECGITWVLALGVRVRLCFALELLCSVQRDAGEF